MKWIASAAFGMEGMTGRDLKHMGMQNVRVMDVGGAMFEGDFADAFRANLWLRTCDRVMLVMAQFEARSYEELFQGVKAIEWEKLMPEDAAFPIRAKCVKSQLMSPSDVQKIGKRAMVERMKSAYGVDWFSETGVTFQVDISIRNDLVTVAVDASGEPLSKRGYRTWNGEAPLRETLAAALVLQSGWHPWQPLYDPCCGTGTILIEAAFIALNRAPGLTRKFAMEAWPCVPIEALNDIRREARLKYEEGSKRPIHISGSDIDPEAIELAKRHLKQAGLAGRIELEVQGYARREPRRRARRVHRQSALRRAAGQHPRRPRRGEAAGRAAEAAPRLEAVRLLRGHGLRAGIRPPGHPPPPLLQRADRVRIPDIRVIHRMAANHHPFYTRCDI